MSNKTKKIFETITKKAMQQVEDLQKSRITRQEAILVARNLRIALTSSIQHARDGKTPPNVKSRCK